MLAPRFVHLRMHSEYSVNDGIVRLDDAVKRAADRFGVGDRHEQRHVGVGHLELEVVLPDVKGRHLLDFLHGACSVVGVDEAIALFVLTRLGVHGCVLAPGTRPQRRFGEGSSKKQR